MAFFECSIGGSSGDGVALIVECDASFAGSVITADNGEDSFSETCPTVAPYTVKFDGIPTGTYTISGVSGGVTITKQFTVLDYTTTLHVIPNGSTVTPVNDIQIWLHCADIYDKNYTTLDEVLADASTLQALIASNNAADYMARSTTWASSVCADANAMTYIGANDYCAEALLSDSTWLEVICNSAYFESVLNVKVPTMTSATTPSGNVFANAYYSSQYPWLAFDKNTATLWLPPAGVTNNFIGYTFVNPIKTAMMSLVINGNTSVTRSFIVQASNDNFVSDINNLDTFSLTWAGAELKTLKYIYNYSNAYKSFRLFCADVLHVASRWSIDVREIQFYGRA